MKDITPETLLTQLFKPFPKSTKQWYIEWNGQRFVRETSKGPKWTWTSKGRAFSAFCDCIIDLRPCPLVVMSREYPNSRDYTMTRENVEWYVNKLEEEGIIQFKSLDS